MPAIRTPPGRNRSDDAAYDARFPNHPLSRVRRLLRRVAITSWLTHVSASDTTEW